MSKSTKLVYALAVGALSGVAVEHEGRVLRPYRRSIAHAVADGVIVSPPVSDDERAMVRRVLGDTAADLPDAGIRQIAKNIAAMQRARFGKQAEDVAHVPDELFARRVKP